jgi:hypothetical protein
MDLSEKNFDIQITQRGQTVTGKFELDKSVKAITGISLTADREDLLYNRGKQKIEINGSERFEENFESKRLTVSNSTDINKRFKTLKNTNPGNHSVVITYTDNEHPLFPFVPYRVSLYVAFDT